MDENDITIIEGDDLDHLLDLANGTANRSGIYRLRIWRNADSGEVKVKFNEGTWTTGLGQKGNYSHD